MKIKSFMILALAGALLNTSCSQDKDLGGILSDTQLIQEVQLNCEKNLKLAVGMSKQVETTISPADVADPTLTWESYNKDIASVDANGKIEALKVGDATIAIRQAHCLNTLVSMSIKVMPVATDVEVEDFSMYEGTSRQLEVVLTPMDAYDVMAWTSSNTEIATVDEEGNVSALKPGTTTITATTTDGTNISASATLTVKQVVPVESLNLTSLGYDLNIGDKGTIKCELVPADATADLLTWSSSDESIVTVDSKGEVTGVGYGTAVITATSSNGKSASVNITVGEGTINHDFGKDISPWYNHNGSTVSYDGTCMTYNMASGGKWRGDLSLASNNNKVKLNVGTYRYFAIKMTRPGGYALNWNGNGTIVLDTQKGRYQQSQGNGNNRYSIWGYDNPADCPMDEPAVLYFDLQSTFGNAGYTFPTDGLSDELTTFKFVIADIPNSYAGTYKVYWVHTFKTLDELKAFVENNK